MVHFDKQKMLFLRGSSSSGGAAGAAAGMNLVRYFSRKCAPDLRRINLKVPREEAKEISQGLYQIIKERGPISVTNTWNYAKVLLWQALLPSSQWPPEILKNNKQDGRLTN